MKVSKENEQLECQ